MSDPVGSSSVSLEDIEASSAEPKAVDLTQALDGEEVPEELRGKTMAEVIAIQKGMKDALMTSEQARKNAETLAATAAAATAQPAPAPAPEPTPEPELSEEQIAELHQEDPIKAIKYMNAQAIRVAEKNLEARLGPMMAGTAASVEENARAKYSDDFEVIGSEIEKFIQALPNKQVLANPQGWDDMISLVRGKNLDKIIEHKINKASDTAKETAQQEQKELTGFQPGAGPVRPATAVPSRVEALDDTQKEIAGKLGMTLEDYVKWGAVTS